MTITNEELDKIIKEHNEYVIENKTSKSYSRITGVWKSRIVSQEPILTERITELPKIKKPRNDAIKTCPHCGVTAKALVIGRYHNDRCKMKGKVNEEVVA